MDYEKIIEELFVIMTDIDARNCSANALSDLSWDELCDRGIDLLNQLKA